MDKSRHQLMNPSGPRHRKTRDVTHEGRAVRPRGRAGAAATLLKFLASGASTALLFLVLCYGLTRGGLDPFAASLLAYGMAFGVGYGLQRWWTFEGRHRHGSALPRYLLLQAGCALLSGLVSWVGATGLHLAPLPMATATTIMAGAVSFLVSRYWVFPHERSDTEQPI